jgi:hypothetical protein
MKTSDTREILLLTTTSFSKRQLCETDPKEKNINRTPAEQLEAACWNGLLGEVLKGVMEISPVTNKLFLWQVDKEKSYLRLSLSDSPPVFDKQFTLDPHIFLSEQEMN